MSNRFHGKFIAVFLSALIALSAVLPASAAETTPKAENSAVEPTEDTANDYNSYYSTLTAGKYEGEGIALDAVSYASLDGKVTVEDVADKKNVLVWQKGEGSISYRFTVPETARYCLSLTYLPMQSTSVLPETGVMIDGVYLFDEAKAICLERFWVNADNEVHADSVGNEYSADQVYYTDFVDRQLKDCDGLVKMPYEFYITAGEHTITLNGFDQDLAIAQIALTAPDALKKYSEIVGSYTSYKNYSGTPIVIEGEKAELKNSMSLVAKCDNSSLSITPASATISRLNYIGGSTWKKSGDELTWTFEAPEDGLYKIGFSFKQSDLTNGYVYRTVKIDGKIPFEEAYAVKFGYSTAWQFEQLADENGEPCLVYLQKGTHTISLAAVLGEMADFYLRLKDLIFQLSETYIDIIMITGESPDINRDYDLFKQIPDFSETLESMRSDLERLSKDMAAVSVGGGDQYTSIINSMVRVLQEMIDNPYTAQKYLSEYSSQYTSLGTLLSDMTSMPLKLDQIRIAAPDGDFENADPNIFERFFFSIKRFCASFIGDYSHVSVAGNTDKQIKIWCNWGRDQAMILNSLNQQSFTPSTGIGVNLELTNASLINGIISNTQPDLQLHMSRTEPVNLAMRGALYDLSKFDDYESVMERFGDSAGIPYEYNGGHYALPDTQSFYIMFYRSDILEKLGVEVPNTWEEFLKAASIIMRNNMTVYLPYTQITATTTVNTGVGGLNLFASTMQQFGINMYNSERNHCNLDTPTALSAFSFWTEMYTKYKVPTTQSFYNRFKAGTCPLGIEGYGQCTQIEQAAPEIDGLWGITLIPGIEKEDGTIDRSISGSGSGCAILQKSQNKELAWEFLKWWTSAETQLAYNNGVESILGTISRTATATIEAFEGMSWKKDNLEILLEQRKQIVEVPEVPGSYYVARAVDQAFWSVVNGDSNEKDALIKWGEIANNEIKRKINQYS